MNESGNLWSEDELLHQAEVQQKELEDLKLQLDQSEERISTLASQKQTLSTENFNLQQRIQEYSLKNSMLENELQIKSDKIVKLSERIGALSESDRQLAEAEQKLAQSRQLEQDVIQKEQDLQHREMGIQDTADKYHTLLLDVEKKQDLLDHNQTVYQELVEAYAAILSSSDRQEMEKEYQARKRILTEYVVWLTLFLLVTSILSAVRQKVFLADLTDFARAIWKGITFLAKGINHISVMASSITEHITQPTLSAILWWFIRISIPVIAITLIVVPAYIIIKKYGRTIIDKGINKWNFSLSVMILAVFIFFGDYVKMIVPCNLVAMWLIIVLLLFTVISYICKHIKQR